MDGPPRVRPSVEWALRAALAGVFLIAAVSKVLDSNAARAAVRYLLPAGFGTPSITLALVATLAAVKAAFACVLLALPRSRVALVLVSGTLVVFTGVLVRLAVDEHAPACGCLGVPRFLGSSSPEAWMGIVRNVGMFGCTLVLLRGVPKARSAPVRAIAANLPRTTRAFTLIEVLVSIAVVAVLMGLILPALWSARYGGKVTAACATIRQLGAACVMYTNSNRDFLPYLGTPGEPDRPLAVRGYTLDPSLYFQQSRYYVNLLYPDYYADQESLRRPFASGVPVPTKVLVSRYDLTNCAFAAPAYWVGEYPPPERTLFRGQRLVDAAHPTRKGLLLDLATGVIAPNSPVHYPGPITVGLVDGSAGQRRYDETSNGRTVTRPYGSSPWPVMATKAGFEGWDFW
ncbi:MAG: prepilin-type N-terminal cleavage/methylation domain-containing protein [Phycisphaerales bacterium]|nr:prepilin-type N-terminal cleavage/methylation domain-containing protein [Phycisphaerales bacterium]